jgi:hypothetical protein
MDKNNIDLTWVTISRLIKSSIKRSKKAILKPITSHPFNLSFNHCFTDIDKSQIIRNCAHKNGRTAFGH